MMIRIRAGVARFRCLVLCALVVAPAVTALPTGVNPETLQQLMLPLQTALKGVEVPWACDSPSLTECCEHMLNVMYIVRCESTS